MRLKQKNSCIRPCGKKLTEAFRWPICRVTMNFKYIDRLGLSINLSWARVWINWVCWEDNLLNQSHSQGILDPWEILLYFCLLLWFSRLGMKKLHQLHKAAKSFISVSLYWPFVAMVFGMYCVWYPPCWLSSHPYCLPWEAVNIF